MCQDEFTLHFLHKLCIKTVEIKEINDFLQNGGFQLRSAILCIYQQSVEVELTTVALDSRQNLKQYPFKNFNYHL